MLYTEFYMHQRNVKNKICSRREETCSWVDFELGGAVLGIYSVQYSIFLLSTNRLLVIHAC